MKPSFAPHVWQGILAAIAFVAAGVHLDGNALTLQIALPSYLVGSVTAVLAVVGIFSQALPDVKRARAAWLLANGPKALFPVLALALLGATQTACLSSAPIVPVTAVNQQQVSSCQSTASLHDDVVIGDFVVGAFGAGAAGVAAAVPGSNPGLATGLAVGAAVATVVTAAGAGVASLTASNFTNSNCSSVVGPLPVSSTGKSAWVRDEGGGVPTYREAVATVRPDPFAVVTWGATQ